MILKSIGEASLQDILSWGNVKDGQLVYGLGAISIFRARLRDSHTSCQNYFLNLHFQQSPLVRLFNFLHLRSSSALPQELLLMIYCKSISMGASKLKNFISQIDLKFLFVSNLHLSAIVVRFFLLDSKCVYFWF
jgi:hypothetical protein